MGHVILTAPKAADFGVVCHPKAVVQNLKTDYL